jgi:hypothetical protein
LILKYYGVQGSSGPRPGRTVQTPQHQHRCVAAALPSGYLPIWNAMPDQLLFRVCQLSQPATTFEEDVALLTCAVTPDISTAEHKLADRANQVAALLSSGLKASACFLQNVSHCLSTLQRSIPALRTRRRGWRSALNSWRPSSPTRCL